MNKKNHALAMLAIAASGADIPQSVEPNNSDFSLGKRPMTKKQLKARAASKRARKARRINRRK